MKYFSQEKGIDPCCTKQSGKRANAVFIVLFVAALVFSVWKLSYGFGWYDEAFYITIPHRMTLGDAFIADEWHPAQLFGFLTMPFVTVFRSLRGNTDGIMLYMRFVYVFIHFLIGFFLYKRLSGRYGIAAVLCTLSFLLFTPFDIMAPSYNSICADLIVFMGVGIATEKRESRRISYVLYGVAYAGTVLCCPYLVVLLPAFVTIAIVGRRNPEPLITIKELLLFVTGIAILFIAFMVFECTHTNITELIRNFPQLFMDAEHTGESIFDKLKAYFNHAPHHFMLAVALFSVVLIGLILDKNRKKHGGVWVTSACVAAVWGYAWSYANLNEYYNAIMMPLFFPGFVCYTLLKNKPRRLFAFTMLTGLVYSICICLASNVGFHAVSIAYSTANIASWVFIAGYLKEQFFDDESNKEGNRSIVKYMTLLALTGTALCLLFLQVKTKATHVFYDEKPSALTSVITEGPAKGIKTTKAKAGEYDRYLKEITSFTENGNGKHLLVLSEKTWCYLMNDNMRYATYSAWLSGVNETSINRLQEYFGSHEDAVPDLIFIDKPFCIEEKTLNAYAEQYGYSVTSDKNCYQLIRTIS